MEIMPDLDLVKIGLVAMAILHQRAADFEEDQQLSRSKEEDEVS